MSARTFLPAVLTLAAAAYGLIAADSPKPTDAGVLIVVDASGKEHKLKSWKFTAGVRNLSWLAPAAPPEKEPTDKDKDKGGRPAPRKAAPAGPEALVIREDNSTTWENGVLTFVPVDRLRSIEYNAEKETVAIKVATGKDGEATLTGSTEYQGINKIGVDAEVDKGDLGVAEVRFTGGVPKGIKSMRFPIPKAAPADPKEARPAAITYGDKKNKYVVNVTDLQPLYRTADGEVLSGLLFFKKTIKVDVSKLKKIVPHKEEGTLKEPAWGVTLKSGGDEEAFTLLTRVQFDGKDAQLEGLLGRVPAGYKLFPVHLLQEVEFDVKKDEGEPKKPDGDK